tara:strand:- start:94 stop:507 length:414 start_codon:yes stop_codon:yes gene_type:complete
MMFFLFIDSVIGEYASPSASAAVRMAHERARKEAGFAEIVKNGSEIFPDQNEVVTSLRPRNTTKEGSQWFHEVMSEVVRKDVKYAAAFDWFIYYIKEQGMSDAGLSYYSFSLDSACIIFLTVFKMSVRTGVYLPLTL